MVWLALRVEPLQLDTKQELVNKYSLGLDMYILMTWMHLIGTWISLPLTK